MFYFDIDSLIEFLGFIRFNNDMYQTIHKTVRVAGVFKQGQFRPVWFDWQGRRYDIAEITLISDFKQGQVAQTIYSVLAKGNVYRLVHDLSSCDWFLEQVWIDN